MSFHPHDDLPDPPRSVPGHDPMVVRYDRTETDPAEVSVSCLCGWEFESQESAGGGVEPWGAAWDEHLVEIAAEADCGDGA